ncbi:DUF533 domain-containing protein [Lichenibacterium dinghuense]|uniref:DUF533 domain-containing protein n=1 Tax=Lichenibacterium dinghuense TaxID=2895977 RepID=UPI001F3DBA0B|nr:DUF533 domain-containing protein [Lichenibacterium sp. 6Y81]
MTEAAAAPRSGFLAGLQRLLERRVDHDGAAPALEIPPTAAPPVGGAADGGDVGRRDRRLRLPQEILDRSLSAKVLDGWLQNRHQVLVPLTFRLGRLEAGDVAVLMRFTATALLNASKADEAARRGVERWLGEVGAAGAAIAQFRAALDAPEPLSRLVAAVRERDLAPYAYAAAVVASDARDPAGRLFANFIAARLALPADAVRSVDRRYRR